ncbi:MAG: HEPN domain-containing protein [Butyricicoccus sp.]|nr:HEPN domain-containing protein [Butyricicoccus sp.]MBQ8585128.1 HEPN domain-containing protein [Butyricicoccus sp.]
MTRKRKSGNSDSLYYYKWLDKALADLQASRILLTWNGDPSIIAFHCQQAIEKALKGYLLFKTGRHFDGHNLTFLCRQATNQDPQFAEWLDESALLNNLYIETRYPNDLPLRITKTDCQRYFTMADNMFTAIRRELYGEDEGPAPIQEKSRRR